MAWTPLAPSNYLHTKEAKDPKETDRGRNPKLYGHVHYVELLFPIHFWLGLVQKLKSFIFVSEINTKYVVKSQCSNKQKRVKRV